MTDCFIKEIVYNVNEERTFPLGGNNGKHFSLSCLYWNVQDRHVVYKEDKGGGKLFAIGSDFLISKSNRG